MAKQKEEKGRNPVPPPRKPKPNNQGATKEIIPVPTPKSQKRKE
jgi:hypothetical protein